MSQIGRRIGYGFLAVAVTKLARRATRNAMYSEEGVPRLPAPARHGTGLGTLLALAAATGAVLALADLLSEQRKEVATREPPRHKRPARVTARHATVPTPP